LKAVLTDTNRTWDALSLQRELSAEDAAMHGGQGPVHTPGQDA
ncbi:MAG: DUF3783 domain-containing protein, partial [Bacteroidales bacterium]|nr:DUF3783 domain-containing protein [Bacteroidales bacterium]